MLRHLRLSFRPRRDYRVRLVGEQVFESEVRSQAEDCRYGLDSNFSIWATRLPREIVERAVVMSKAMALEVAGIDLRRTPEAECYCLRSILPLALHSMNNLVDSDFWPLQRAVGVLDRARPQSPPFSIFRAAIQIRFGNDVKMQCLNSLCAA
jgi:hypothetical protein